MMKVQLKSLISTTALVAVALFASSQVAHAGTIIKLNLGGTGPDIQYTGGLLGVLSTVNDGGPYGDQATAIEYVGDLDFLADEPFAVASYSLSNVLAAGPASVINGQVGQLFNGGSFQLYDSSGDLLLDVTIGASAFSGFVGSTTGAEFSIDNGLVQGGWLAQYLVDDSITFSIALNGINGPSGLNITPLGPPIIAPPFEIIPATINAFTADASKIIGGEVVPEPATGLLMVLGSIAATGLVRRRAS